MTRLLLICDLVTSMIFWCLFFVIRKYIETGSWSLAPILSDDKLIIGLALMVPFWYVLWWILGTYHRVEFSSRIGLLYKTLAGTLLGSFLILMTVIQDDLTLDRVSYVYIYGVLCAVSFGCFYLDRIFFHMILSWCLTHGYHRLTGLAITRGTKMDVEGLSYVAFHCVSAEDAMSEMQKTKPQVIFIDDIEQPVESFLADIIGQSYDSQVLIDESLLDDIPLQFQLAPYHNQSYLSLRTHPLSSWQRYSKRFVDICGGIVGLLLSLPIMMYLWLRVRISTRGDVLFRQKRLGQYGIPFTLLKFVTMRPDAEADGPALASQDDARCTAVGRWMRIWRLDELPQFINVIKGDMSLVGPRPERKYFADQIIATEPQYPLLWQVKPGLTSWGQIKFGYASTIEEIKKRFKYDLQYVEQMSLLLDIRIIYYTIKVLLQGKGR